MLFYMIQRMRVHSFFEGVDLVKN